MISDHTRRQKSREVSSRYLSPNIAPPSPLLGPLTNNDTLNSPNHHNPKSSASTKQKHKHTGFIRGLWPSSTTHSSKSHNENHPTPTTAVTATTLADCLGNERRRDGDNKSENSPFLSKQNSCSDFRRLEKNSSKKNSSREHHTPIFGGRSMRFNGGKSMFSGRSSISPATSSSSSAKSSDVSDSNQIILPGRLSVDENALRRRSSYFSDNSENSDVGSPFTTGRNSPASYMAPTFSSKMSELDFASTYMNMNMSPSVLPMHNSPKNSMLKTAMKRATSSEWESSPSRLGSPLFSGSKPPTSTSRGKKNLLHLGLDLIKGKKGGLKLGRSSPSDLDTATNMDSVHQLRLLQSSWMQWRYVNARAQDVHDYLAAQCENDLLDGCESVAKLRQSVVQKRLQLQKQNLYMKLNLILHSQIKMLEAWGNIERRHIIDISVLRDYLLAVVCMIPLVEGAKVDLESATLAFQHTSHLVASIKSMLSSFSPIAHETMVTLSELAEVVNQEKLLLEECFEHLGIISTLEIQEGNLRCSIIAMDSSSEWQQNKQEIFM